MSDTNKQYQSRKEFIEAMGATCKNWRSASWSFVNRTAKVVIFGAEESPQKPDGSWVILDEEWNEKNERPGYNSAHADIQLVEQEGYRLEIFPQTMKKGEDGKAHVKDFTSTLIPCRLHKSGREWIAVRLDKKEKNSGKSLIVKTSAGLKIHVRYSTDGSFTIRKNISEEKQIDVTALNLMGTTECALVNTKAVNFTFPHGEKGDMGYSIRINDGKIQVPEDLLFVPDHKDVHGLMALMKTHHSIKELTKTLNELASDPSSPVQKEKEYFVINADIPVSDEDIIQEGISAEKSAEHCATGAEKERVVKARIGQGAFRERLISKHGMRCMISGVSEPSLLIASHIKPWSHCANDAEKVDVNNGLLLEARYDKLFDEGFISFADDGAIMLSASLSLENQEKLTLDEKARIELTGKKMRGYMAYHRREIFKGDAG